MSMLTRIQAFIPDTDPEYQKHKKIFDLCEESEVSLPKETAEYFKGWDRPEQKLLVELIKNVHYTTYNKDMCEGFEVKLSNLPTGVTKIRFFNSY